MSSISVKNAVVEFPLIDQERRFLRYELITRAFKPISSVAAKSQLVQKVGAKIMRPRAGIINVLALDDISLELSAGDRLGIIGPNGSGKSTLLRTLAGIYHPIRGSVSIDGRVTTMFSLTQGMDPDASGIDNIYLRAKFLDIPKRMIAQKVDEIAEFSELGEFLHLPLRTYSPGMMVRLAFSVTTIENPDILILDEIVGAGDALFMAKAQARMREYIDRAGLMVLASHSDAILREWCNKGLFLNQGKIISYGPIDEVMDVYHQFVHGSAA